MYVGVVVVAVPDSACGPAARAHSFGCAHTAIMSSSAWCSACLNASESVVWLSRNEVTEYFKASGMTA